MNTTDWLNSNINKITNWNSLIEIYHNCQSDGYSDEDCTGCILNELVGEFIHSGGKLNPPYKCRETACFLIIHKDDAVSKPIHGLDKIKRLILPLND